MESPTDTPVVVVSTENIESESQTTPPPSTDVPTPTPLLLLTPTSRSKAVAILSLSSDGQLFGLEADSSLPLETGGSKIGESGTSNGPPPIVINVAAIVGGMIVLIGLGVLGYWLRTRKSCGCQANSGTSIIVGKEEKVWIWDCEHRNDVYPKAELDANRSRCSFGRIIEEDLYEQMIGERDIDQYVRVAYGQPNRVQREQSRRLINPRISRLGGPMI